MRLQEWHAILDEYQDALKKTHFMYRDERGAVRAAFVSRIVDSRNGPPSSEELLSIENSLLRDVDGLIIRVNNQYLFVAAAILSPNFFEKKSIVNGERFYVGYPKELVCMIQCGELELAEYEPFLTQEKFDQMIKRLIQEVEMMYGDDALTYIETRAAFDISSAYGMWFLESHAARMTFNALASAAQAASWEAKYVENHGGNPRSVYVLKNTFLNQLMMKYLTSTTHERIALSLDQGELGIALKIPVRILGSVYGAHYRRLHLPLDCLTKDTVKKIAYVYPGLYAEMRKLSKCPRV